MRTADDERAWRLSRHLRVLAAASGTLIVGPDQVSVIPDDAWTAALLLTDHLDTSEVGRPFAEDDLVRLRRAVGSVGTARDLEQFVNDGHPAMRAWRHIDRVALLHAARVFQARAEWALHPDRSFDGQPAEGVLVADAGRPGSHERVGEHASSAPGGSTPSRSPRRAPDAERPAGRTPRAPTPGGERAPRYFVSDVIRRDLAVARRVQVVIGAEVAARWTQSAETRWWPPPEFRTTLDAFAELVDRTRTSADLAALVAEISAYCQSFMVDFRGHTPRRMHRSWDEIRALHQADTRGKVLACISDLHDTAAQNVGDAERGDVLDLLLLTRGASWPVDPAAAPSALRDAGGLLRKAPPRWRERAAPDVPTWLSTAECVPSWLIELDPALAPRVLACWPVPTPNRPWSVSRLRRYLDVLEHSGTSEGQTGERANWLRQKWVAQLANSDLATGAFTLLLLADRTEHGIEQAVAALVAGFGAPPTLRKRLTTWATPRVPDDVDPPSVDWYAGDLELPRELVVSYLHFRVLAGADGRLPRHAERLLDGARPDAQRTALSRRINETPAGTHRDRLIEVLAAQDERNADPDAQAGRRRHALRRLRNQLERGTADYTLASLRKILTDQATTMIGGTAADLPMRLLGDVAWLACDENTDAAILNRFLTTTLHGDSLLGWPENQEWIQRVRPTFGVDTWLKGFDFHATVGDTPIHFLTDQDPWRALHMGSWFDTCLDLETGFNRASALTNVIEANRHVVYGIDPSGTVVARKLIAITHDGALIGYRTYAHHDHTAHDRVISAACATLAERCGLRRRNTGRPESLTGAFWYDDGVTAWAPTASPLTTPPRHTSLIAELDEAEGHTASRLLDVLLRDRIDDDAVEATVLSTPSIHLVHALWLDGRVADPARIFDRYANDHDQGDWVSRVPLVDPTAIERVAADWRGRPRELGDLTITPSTTAGTAALRINSRCDEAVYGVVHPAAAISYLAHVAAYPPSLFTIRLLRQRGADPRRLRKAIVRLLRRYWAGDRTGDIQRFMPTYIGAAASTRWLLSRLDDRELQRAAALELASRGADVARTQIARLAEEHPTDLHLTAAAVALGGTTMTPAFLDAAIGARSAPLLRLAVRRGLSPAAIEAGDPRLLARFGPLDLVPENPDDETIWKAAQVLDHALQLAAEGDWGALAFAIRNDGGWLDDPEVQDLVLRSLTGTPDDLKGALAIAEATSASGSSYSTAAEILLHTLTTIASRAADTDPSTVARAFALAIKRRRSAFDEQQGALAALARAVGPPAIAALAVDDGNPKPNASQWIIAAMLDEQVRPPPPRTGTDLAQLVDAIQRTHTLPDAERATNAIVTGVDDQVLGDACAWCIEGRRLTSMFSRTQLALLGSLSRRSSEEASSRLSTLVLALRSRIDPPDALDEEGPTATTDGTAWAAALIRRIQPQQNAGDKPDEPDDGVHRATWILERLAAEDNRSPAT